MRRPSLHTVICLLAAAVAGCGDTTATPADKGLPPDARSDARLDGPRRDTPGLDTLARDAPRPDGSRAEGPKPDGVKPLSCSEVTACTAACASGCAGGDMTCVLGCSNGCRAMGCPSAQTSYDQLAFCILGQCAAECGAGMTPACQACVPAKCGAEVAACMANHC